MISVCDAPDQCLGRGRLQRFAIEHPWSVGQGMLRFDFTALDGKP